MAMVGHADWFSHLARDVPLADITRGKHEVGIEMAAVGYRYTLEEWRPDQHLAGEAERRSSPQRLCRTTTP